MGTEFNMIKKYRKYIITLILIIAMCVSICFIPIDATRFIPVVEKQFQQDLGVQVHIERLINHETLLCLLFYRFRILHIMLM